jgi:Tfp pilus assembly protein PilF
LLLLGLALAVFSPLSHAEFVHWDDYQTVASNSAMNPATLDVVMQYWSPWHAKMDLYAPVTYSLWGILAAISPRQTPTAEGFTLSPALFHLANLLLHAVSAIIVWQILRRLVQNHLAALAGAVLFLVHPVQVEVVGWISGGKDVLSGMLCLLALRMYIDFAQAGDGKSQKKYVAYGIATIAFVAATLAKPQAVALPLVAGVIDVLWLKRNLKTAVTGLLLWFAWCIPVALIGRTVQSANLLYSPVWFRPVVALDAIAFYLGKIFWPAKLMADYGRSPQWLIVSPDRFWTWIVPVMVIIVCIAVQRRTWRPLAIIFLFIAALAPVLGILQFDFQSYSTVGDHYLYLAMLAPILAVAWVVAQFDWKKWIAPALLIVAACAIASNRQCGVWRDTETLFQHNYELNPSSLAAETVLGVYWSEHGNPKFALQLLAEAVRDHPNIGLSHFTYANVLMKQNLMDQSLSEYRQAITLTPTKARYYTNFGVALGKSGHPDLAMAAFQNAAGLDPSDSANYENAAITLLKGGQVDRARWFLNRVLELDPSRADVRQLLQSLPTTRGGAG